MASPHERYGGDDSTALPAVNPIWPLLATMLGGAWMGWTWFLVNALALGGERRGRQYAALGIGVLGSTIMAFVVAWLHVAEITTEVHLKYFGILLTGWKLAIAYLLCTWQRREFQLLEYYGGTVRNGLLVALSGILLRGLVLGELIPTGWWTLVLS